MSPFLTGVPSSMARSTSSGMAQAFGLIETSVIRSASKTPREDDLDFERSFLDLGGRRLAPLAGSRDCAASVLATGLSRGFLRARLGGAARVGTTTAQPRPQQPQS